MRHAMVAREDLSTIRDRSRKSLSEVISVVEIRLTANQPALQDHFCTWSRTYARRTIA